MPATCPKRAFFPPSRAWLLCRKSKARSGTFGRNRKERGWNFLRTSLVQELAALNKVEVLPLDRWWELAARQDDQILPEDLNLLDRVAGLVEKLDGSFAEVRAAYEDDPRFQLAAEPR